MNKFGLIGYPLSHSLSSVIHKAALNSLGLEGSYELLETPTEDLVSRVKFLKAHNYDGFNITIPHKVPITMFLDQVDETADIAGAVNTVKIMPDKTLYGYNTDVYGFVNAIDKNSREKLSGKKAVIFGTGGASRACFVGLAGIGITEVDFYTRNLINASDKINFLRSKFPNVKINVKNYSSLKLEDISLVVNTTPAGMKNFAMNESILSKFQLSTLPDDAIVYDIVYNPYETKFIKLAKECNLKTVSGIEMFLHQAYKSFEIWTGKTPNFDKMKIAVLESLLLG